MILKFINRIIATALVPIILSTSSPIFMIKKAVNKESELISLSQSDVITEDIHITAHRGVNSLAPENTLPAYEKAVELGYYSAECDIRLTTDNVWVLNHGPFLSSSYAQIGRAENFDYETLKTYTIDSGANFWKYPDLHIATLDEFLDVFVGSQTRPQIEIKSKDYGMLYTVVDAVRAKGLEKQAIIISFDYKQLQTIREYNSEIELWYLVYGITQKSIDKAKALGNCWLSADRSLNNEKSIKKALDQGVGLSIWTINSIKDAEKLYKLGLRYMETDKLCN